MLPDLSLVPPIPHPLPADQPSSRKILPFHSYFLFLIPCVALTTIIGPSSLLCPKCDRWCYTHCLLFLGYAHIALQEMESYIVRSMVVVTRQPLGNGCLRCHTRPDASLVMRARVSGTVTVCSGFLSYTEGWKPGCENFSLRLTPDPASHCIIDASSADPLTHPSCPQMPCNCPSLIVCPERIEISHHSPRP